MSCEMHLDATLEGVDKFLCHNTAVDSAKEDVEKISHSLTEYKIALSPTGEVLVFATSRWLLICGSKWDSNIIDGAKIKYTPNWHGHLQCKIGEEITSLICLPFFSHGQSIQGGADWTCIVVGFSSGCLRFYTEGMLELACTILHEEPISSIKCHNPSLVQQKKTLKQDNNDIYVVYKTVICILNGPNLCQLLINKRNQLAKGIPVNNSDTDNYISLDFKKYGFSNQEAVNDACFLGESLSHYTFDHLVNVSLIGGFSSNYRISPPQTSLFVTSGKRPFVGFHYTLESGNAPVLSDVALAVASKIKSSVTATLPDWFGFGSKKSSQADKPKEVAQDYAEKLNCRFGLCDLWRQGQSIILSPDGTYSAVSDSLGRIFLIDNSTGIALRLWKGFRDAQCGFYQADEDIHKKNVKSSKSRNAPRRGLFIIIYAPKKGLIEIFSTQSGQKVSTFKVTKFGRLLYNPRGCLVSNASSGFSLRQNIVVFISEEGLHNFSIPFHCCLAENNSKMLKDLHIFKKIKLLLTTNVDNASNKIEDIEKCANDIKTNEVRFQCAEFLLNCKNPKLEELKAILNIFMNSLQSEEDQSESSAKKIISLATTALNLLSFYEFLTKIKSASCINDEPEEKTVDGISYLQEEMLMPEKDVEILFKFIEQIQEIEDNRKKATGKVVFEERKSNDLGKFLSKFDFQLFLKNIEHQEREKNVNNVQLRIKLNTSDENLDFLEKFLFEGAFSPAFDINEWILLMEKCSLNPADLAICLLSFWCNNIALNDVSTKIVSFIKILKAISSLSDADVSTVEYNVESAWWSQLRTFIANNSSSVHSLFAALGCRCVTVLVEQEKELSHKKIDKKNLSRREWETISKDTFQWDILITQLQDVALLNAILSLPFKNHRKPNVLPVIPFDFEYQCLTSIQSKGTGRVSELVAKWLCQFGFDPSVFIDKNDLEFKALENELEKENEESNCNLFVKLNQTNNARDKEENANLPLDYLSLLKVRFPYSLITSSLLSNLCWEYIAHWFKNNEIDYLTAATRCLEMIPSNTVKYGISYLCWSTYLEQKFNGLTKMMNRMGKVPKLCAQEVGLRHDQVPQFLELIGKYLNLMLYAQEEEKKQDFDTNQEAVWQNGCISVSSSLVSIAVSQSLVNCYLVSLKLQLSSSLLLMAGLNIKISKIISTLFDNTEQLNVDLTSRQVVSDHNDNRTLKKSRDRFLQKAITAAVQTIHVVENIQPSLESTEEIYDGEITPSTRLDVDEYKKWLQLCFNLAEDWEISFDDLRRHQICELYLNGFDRLAEEVIPSVNENEILASQLLVLIGKRLKYKVQDARNLSNQMANLSFNLSEWLKSLDLENFKPSNERIEDIEVLARYIIKWLPDGHADQNLAFAIIESLASFGTP